MVQNKQSDAGSLSFYDRQKLKPSLLKWELGEEQWQTLELRVPVRDSKITHSPTNLGVSHTCLAMLPLGSWEAT